MTWAQRASDPSPTVSSHVLSFNSVTICRAVIDITPTGFNPLLPWHAAFTFRHTVSSDTDADISLAIGPLPGTRSTWNLGWSAGGGAANLITSVTLKSAAADTLTATNVPSTTGNWHTVDVIYNGTTLSLSIDSVLILNNTAPTVTGLTPIVLVSGECEAGGLALMDNVDVYNT